MTDVEMVERRCPICKVTWWEMARGQPATDPCSEECRNRRILDNPDEAETWNPLTHLPED
jgi:hypothetical protein